MRTSLTQTSEPILLLQQIQVAISPLKMSAASRDSVQKGLASRSTRIIEQDSAMRCNKAAEIACILRGGLSKLRFLT